MTSMEREASTSEPTVRRGHDADRRRSGRGNWTGGDHPSLRRCPRGRAWDRTRRVTGEGADSFRDDPIEDCGPPPTRPGANTRAGAERRTGASARRGWATGHRSPRTRRASTRSPCGRASRRTVDEPRLGTWERGRRGASESARWCGCRRTTKRVSSADSSGEKLAFPSRPITARDGTGHPAELPARRENGLPARRAADLD